MFKNEFNCEDGLDNEEAWVYDLLWLLLISLEVLGDFIYLLR